MSIPVYIVVPVIRPPVRGFFDAETNYLAPDEERQVFFFTRFKRGDDSVYYSYVCKKCGFSVSVELLLRENGRALLAHDCKFACNHLTFTAYDENEAILLPAFGPNGKCSRCGAKQENTFRFAEKVHEASGIVVRAGSDPSSGQVQAG